MATMSTERELLDLEKLYWTAIMEKDAVVALQLTHDPCIVTGASGASQLEPAALAEWMEGAPWILDDFELRDVQVRLVRDDVAIVAYKVKESLIVEGRPLTVEAADSSTWIHSDGRWRCAHRVLA
jgi:hypothetical protein